MNVTLFGSIYHSRSADQQAGALVPYLLGRTKQETWAFAIDASAYSKQEQLHDIAKQKGAKCLLQLLVTPSHCMHCRCRRTSLVPAMTGHNMLGLKLAN